MDRYMENNKVNISKVEEIIKIDKETGVILEESREVHTYQTEKEPKYVKLYTQDIGRLYGLPPSCNKLLVTLAHYMIPKSNMVLLYGPVKDTLCHDLHISRDTLNKAIDTLYKQGFLIRKSRACYIMDPEIFGFGSWSDIKKLRLMIEYNPDGTKSIKTEVTNSKEKMEFGRGIPMKRTPIVGELPLFEQDEV